MRCFPIDFLAAGDSSGGTLSLTSSAFRGPASLSPASPPSAGATFNPPPPMQGYLPPLILLRLSEPPSGQLRTMENRDSVVSLLLLLLLLLLPLHTHQGHIAPTQVQNGIGFSDPMCLNELYFGSVFSLLSSSNPVAVPFFLSLKCL